MKEFTKKLLSLQKKIFIKNLILEIQNDKIKLINLKNVNEEIKIEAQKRFYRDLSE